MKQTAILLVGIIVLVIVSPLVPTKAQQDEEKPMTKQQIVDLLAQGVASRRIAYLVRQRGVAFDVQDEDLELIRSSGGDEELISALNAAKALAESTKWIDNTFDVEGGYGDDNTGSRACTGTDGKGLDAGDFMKKWDWTTHWHCYDRCWYLIFVKHCVVGIIVLSREIDWTDTAPDKFRFKPDEELVFSLHDIDPSSIKSTPLAGDSRIPSPVEIDFRTINDENLISFALLYHGAKREDLRPGHALSDADWKAPVVMKPDYAPRFIKAFRTAVESCGAKSSAF